jgi:PleD family two-component response regulator
LAERIVEQFTADVRAGFPDVGVSMSVGLASLQAINVASADALIRAADRALYQAKAGGKNRIVTASESVSPSVS